ncbi:MAG: L-2-hydroxyglutarate oxidase [Bacteroidetes bacterium]|nr:L-2-hydroxyglutarate oxidase [Bacteroidota bacterium]
MHTDIAIVGGGIVGLATALRIKEQRPDLQVVVLEKEDRVAKHQTGNNSGVIHSGIYYKPGSLKATNCIKGYHMLLEFCKAWDIPYDLCGKVIVATKESELGQLEKLYQRGLDNGLEGLLYLNREEILEKEPHCTGIKGIWVPQTGIVNYRLVSEKMAEAFEKSGGQILTSSQVQEISIGKDRVEITTPGTTVTAKLLINCAGLYCDKIAEMAGQKLDVRIIPFRGEYYSLKPEKAALVKNLIYPVPDPNFPFLGVHFTRRISGEIEAGPNAVFAFRREGYKKTDFSWGEFWQSISWKGFRKVAMKYWRTGFGEYYRSFSKAAFTRALQALVPEVRSEDLEPAGAGVRAQACDSTGGLIDDFYIREGEGCIHVLNAPSPAATSSLSIGQTVSELALRHFEK